MKENIAQKKTKQQLVINQNSFILIEKRAEMKYFNYMNCVCKWIHSCLTAPWTFFYSKKLWFTRKHTTWLWLWWKWINCVRKTGGWLAYGYVCYWPCPVHSTKNRQTKGVRTRNEIYMVIVGCAPSLLSEWCT